MKATFLTFNFSHIFSARHELPAYPGEFATCKKDTAGLQAAISQRYPSWTLATSPSVPARGTWLVPTPSSEDVDPHRPPYMIMRMDHCFSAGAQHRLLNSWRALSALCPVYHLKKESRSKTPALHLGVWHLYQQSPIVTQETRDQRPEVINVMNCLLEEVK